MLKPFQSIFHLPVIPAGGIMVILLFVFLVFLVCNLAADGLSSKVLLQTRTCIPKAPTADEPSSGLDEIESSVAFIACGDEQNRCAAFGHPV